MILLPQLLSRLQYHVPRLIALCAPKFISYLYESVYHTKLLLLKSYVNFTFPTIRNVFNYLLFTDFLFFFKTMTVFKQRFLFSFDFGKTKRNFLHY